MEKNHFMTNGDWTEKIQTTEANRPWKIYMLAIDNAPDLRQLDPPATPQEEKEYKEMCANMRATEKKYKEAGKPLEWSIPFDFD